MDINSAVAGLKCECGKEHSCGIKYVYVEDGAISRLTQLCDKGKNILIVADENTYLAAGQKVEDALCQNILKKVIFSGKTVLIPDEAAIEKVRDNLCDVDLLIGIGSGVIQDLCKYVSFFENIPYMIVATAPSMDGYASTGAAMILKGMKETVSAGLPTAIIADTDILKDAPLDMIKAGFGDIVGKYSALCDWELSHLVNGEYFCQYIYDTTYKMIEKTLSVAEGLLQREKESVKTLMEALVIVGIMMSFAGSSRPASGSEHHLSHFFEIVGIINNEPYFVHGLDVAYSTVITAQIREEILKNKFPGTRYIQPREDYIEKMTKIYSSLAPECIALQDRAGSYGIDRMDVYKSKEKEIRNILAKMPKSEDIQNILALADIRMDDFYEMYNSDKVNNAVMYAKDLKDRYTVLWMYYDFMAGKQNG